ncbi:MAG: hypothetical protein ACJA2W_000977 [Planctomycetota bacterium]|jgi:hypothetical protein
MRSFLTLLCPLLACACAASSDRAYDPVHEAMAVVAGFHDASPAVAEHLESAAAWAVFPNAVPAGPAAARAGLLFTPDHRSVPVELRSTSSAPVSATRHVLVVFSSEEDLKLLEFGPLVLDEAAHLSSHDNHDVAGEDARIWVVTSAVSGLLFTPDPTRLGWAIVRVQP